MGSLTETLPAETTTLFYYLEPKDGGIIQTYPGTAFEKRRPHCPFKSTVNDLRSIHKDFNINNAGFELVNHKTGVKDFGNKEEVEKTYYPEVKELIKRV